MEQELEKISGTVEDVTYHSAESGFTVLLVDVDGDPVTVVGEVPEIAEGEEITATGSYKVHGTYGVQFRAELIERTLPATAGAIRKYLSSGAVKGLGPALAGRIVARFGDDTLTIIEREPERLTEVRGISAEGVQNRGGISTTIRYPQGDELAGFPGAAGGNGDKSLAALGRQYRRCIEKRPLCSLLRGDRGGI